MDENIELNQVPEVRGKILSNYKLSFKETDGLITNFTGVKIKNTLRVENLNIPLLKDDQILRIYSQSESLLDRLFGGFEF